MGGSSQADTKTTTQQLTPEQQQLASLAMPNYQQFAASNPTLPGSSGVAQFDPNQIAGQNSVLGSTGTASNIVGGAANANQFLTSGAALDPSSNPALQHTINAATRPIFQNLNDTTLPGLSADASTGAGGISANVGGSREGIAQGIATRAANDTAGAVSSGIANQGYQSGLNAMLTATGQAPGTAAAQTIPGTIQSTVGDVRQQQNQANLSADQAAKQFADMLPLLKAQFLTQGSSSLPGGSTTSVGTSNKDPGLVQALIGGASAAGGLAGGLGSLIGGTSAAGATSGLTALLPLLMGSDRRMKEGIEYLHTLPNGHRWYKFRYIGDPEVREGVMAQEAQKISPNAVYDIVGGLLAVDYAQILEA